jgi:ribosomal protein S18 acetylase RimI-like enzyme
MNQQLAVRKFEEADRADLKQITATCFDGVSIDQNVQQCFGLVAGKEWQWRKTRHIDADVAANADGIFVAEIDGKTVGYITTRVDIEARIGGIPNYAVLPSFQKQGIGKRLVDTALDYLKEAGMECVRIETLEQNEVGKHFYPKLGFQLVATQHHYAMKL